MLGQLIDGKSIAQNILTQTAKEVAELQHIGATPTLAVLLVGDDRPSHTYVRKKGEAAKKVGMNFLLRTLPFTANVSDISAAIDDIQKDTAVSGLIIQLPLPPHITPKETEALLDEIHRDVDVDCLTKENLGALVMGEAKIVPPTPGAVMSILEHLKVNLIGKNVTILGVGTLVGKPLAVMLMNARASVTTCNSKTRDTQAKCLTADIIVTGVGKKDLLRGGMVSPGAIVIDTGVDFVDGVMYGDVNVTEVQESAAYVTPTPGGVGPITVARLLWNTVILAKKKYSL